MTNRELKKLLKTSYRFSPSNSERSFIREHEQSSMQLLTIIKTEFRFMGWKSAFSGLVLLLVMIGISKGDVNDVTWFISGMLPLAGLLLLAMIGSSERYKMDELEASCRFSLHFVRMVRMLIIGVLSLGIIMIGTLIAEKSIEGSFMSILCCISIPYLINVFSCLLITRKLHRSDDILFCAGATGISCMVPLMIKMMNLNGLMGHRGLALITVIIFALTVRESVIYIKEGEKLTWNLC